MFGEIDSKVNYVVCENTFRDLIEKAKGIYSYEQEKLFEYEIPHKNLSKEQEKIQRENNWARERSNDVYVYGENLKLLAETMLYEKISSGCDTNLQQEVYEAILDEKISTIALTVKRSEDRYDIASIFSQTRLDIEADKNKGNVYNTDIEDFKKKLEYVKNDVSYLSREEREANKDKYVLLEKFSIFIRGYRFNNYEKELQKLVKKLFNEKMTYCIKQNKLIVPKEYLDKGKEGIEEWRELKKNGNKNNSIEKRILRDTIANKKRYAIDLMYEFTSEISYPKGKTIDWTVPKLFVDGKFNRAKITKLTNKILGCKTQQDLIEMSNEDILKSIREYWKGQLMETYEHIDKYVPETQQA